MNWSLRLASLLSRWIRLGPDDQETLIAIADRMITSPPRPG